MPHFSFLPIKDASLPHLFFRWPGRYRHLLRYTNKVMRGRSELSVPERELMGGYVSALNACGFCYSIHSTLAERFGIPVETLDALVADIDTAPISDKLKPLFHYIKKVTETPTKVVAEDVAACTAVGWSEKAVVDALSVASMFACYNRMMDGSGIPAVAEQNRQKETGFMFKVGYMPWFMAPIFGIWGWFRNPG